MPRLKVVAHKKSGQLLKGYAELPVPVEVTPLSSHGPVVLPKSIDVTPEDGGKPVHVSVDSLKAVFFVKTFEGDSTYSETRFFNPEPRIEGLWVHVTFQDGEATEGIIHNSIGFLNEPGFLLKPPDLQSNNQAVYVLKNALSEFRVVGVRTSY